MIEGAKNLNSCQLYLYNSAQMSSEDRENNGMPWTPASSMHHSFSASKPSLYEKSPADLSLLTSQAVVAYPAATITPSSPNKKVEF